MGCKHGIFAALMLLQGLVAALSGTHSTIAVITRQGTCGSSSAENVLPIIATEMSLGWELQRAPLREPRGTSILNSSHCRIYPVHDGRSRDTEPWATDCLCMDPSGWVLKDAVSLLQQVTPQLLLAEVWLSLALGLRDSPAVATALGACPVLWPRLRSLPWAATPAGFTHTVAPMAALCRRGTGSATSPAHHRAGKARLEGPFGWKIRGVEPGGWVLEGPEFSSSP